MLYSNTFLNIYFIDLESFWNYHKPGQADEFKTRTMFILFNYFSKQVSKAAGGQRKMKMSHLRGIIIIITCTSEFQWFYETLTLKLFKVRKIILLNFRTTFQSNYGFKMLILLDYKNVAPQGWILYTNKTGPVSYFYANQVPNQLDHVIWWAWLFPHLGWVTFFALIKPCTEKFHLTSICRIRNLVDNRYVCLRIQRNSWKLSCYFVVT